MSTEKMRQEASRFRSKEERKDFYCTVLITLIIAVIIAVINF